MYPCIPYNIQPFSYSDSTYSKKHKFGSLSRLAEEAATEYEFIDHKRISSTKVLTKPKNTSPVWVLHPHTQ